MKTNKFIVSLLMARRNYDVAVILDEVGLLESVVIDAYYNPKRYPVLKIADKLLPTKIVNRYAKYIPNVDPSKVISDWNVFLEFQIGLLLNRHGDYYKSQINAYSSLSRNTINYLKKRKSETFDIYNLDTASLEIFSWVKKNNYPSSLVLEQCVASRRQQIDMHHLFSSKFGLANSKNMVLHCEKLRNRELQEWEMADKILVPSNFVKAGIIKEGIDPNKIELLPYGYTPSVSYQDILKNIDKKFSINNAKKTILFAGNAGLRKGISDLLLIADKLKNEDVEFIVAGKMEQEIQKIEKIPGNVKFLGKLSREDMAAKYQSADIFFLPSYLEGSALVTYEAMSWGLPLVTTEEAGSVVTNFEDGFIADSGNLELMSEYLVKLIHDDNLRFKMANRAVSNVREYSIDNYKQKLLQKLKG